MLLEQLADNVLNRFEEYLVDRTIANDEITIEIPKAQLRGICHTLRDDSVFGFETLVDVTCVDYGLYGQSDWQTDEATGSGFGRGVDVGSKHTAPWDKPQFAVVYHLLSISNNQRIRVRTFADPEPAMIVPSVVAIWSSANWFEREAFDMFGILFDGHPDLRRILTDYGFRGHPFRKDFPLSGEVEMRYDAALGRVIYQPVTIEPRVLVPKVIRHEHSEEVNQEGEQ